ncbi:AI-2E family transporter [Nodosilinea sp. E11]|uniref:AI-2E family transporter n=1 Tax=Nodosilinea sp. E11 TaxID=3037479 RepID=UPI0029345D1A|nr:AI-2E family transporter [Nodosilinea sp. E11]WOD40225.1 AI-2E family transporter [Nodosilinea sp. E11]
MRFGHWLSLVIVGVCLYILWVIRNVLLLVLAAVVLVVVLNRAVVALQKYLPNRRAAVFVIFSSALLLLGLFGGLVIPPFITQLQALGDLTPLVLNQVYTWFVDLADSVPGFSIQNYQDLENIFRQIQALNLDIIFGRFFRLFSNTLAIAFNLLLLLMLVLMMLLNPVSYQQLLLQLFPHSLRPQVRQVLDNCEAALSSWFIGIFVTMVAVALMSLAGLWMLDIPFALANGILAGLLAFIPNLGPLISVLPPVALALLESPWKAIAVVVLYLVIYQVAGRWLTARVMPRRVALLPAVTLLAQIFFTAFFGLLGLVLALPLTLIIQQWLKAFWFERVLEQH